MKKTYRPGVYSEYDVQGDYRKNGSRFAFYCGEAKTRQGVSLKAGGVVKLSDLAQLNTYFDQENGGGEFYHACRILLQCGVPGVYAVPVTVDGSAAGIAGYRSALAALTEVKQSGTLLCASGELAVLQEMKERLEACAASQKEKIGVAPVAPDQAVSLAGQINSERIVLCCQKGKTAETGEEESGIYPAAALAGMLAGAEPNANLNGAGLDGLSEVEALTEERIEGLLAGGVTVMEQGETVPECIRAVTCRTMTEGLQDRTFSSVNVTLCIDDILQTARNRLKFLLKGAPLGSVTMDGIASQLSILLEEKREQGLLTAFEPPVVFQNDSDPEVCIAELEFHLASVVSQIYLTAHISI